MYGFCMKSSGYASVYRELRTVEVGDQIGPVEICNIVFVAMYTRNIPKLIKESYNAVPTEYVEFTANHDSMP